MPTTPGEARRLLKAKEALVVKLNPFTIRLKKLTSSYVQPIELKFDPGSKFTGIALVTNDAPVFLAELEHRGEVIKGNLKTRSECRRRRRSSNLRYRPARFNNRVKSKRTGWIAPSLRHRLETIVSWVDKFRRLAPITGLAYEKVKFDTQLMENPSIEGVGYQQGDLFECEIYEFLLERDGRICVYCDATGVGFEKDHVRPRAHGGSNRPGNLVLSCRPCNQEKGERGVEDFLKNSNGRLTRARRNRDTGEGEAAFLKREQGRLVKVRLQQKKSLKDAAAVNITRNALFDVLSKTGLPVRTGSGGQTRWNRHRFGVPKGHALDASCVGDLDRLVRWNLPVMKIKSIGRGSHQIAQRDGFGFPKTLIPWLHVKSVKCSEGSDQCVTFGDKSVQILPSKRVFTKRGWVFPKDLTDTDLVYLGAHRRVRKFTAKTGKKRSRVVLPKGELQKVRGKSGKRPYGFATGDFVRLPDGKVGRVSGARSEPSQKVHVPGEVDAAGKAKHRGITFKKLVLLERASGYHIYCEPKQKT
jgi:hypothetical protein